MPLSLLGVAISDFSGDDISPVSASQPASQNPNSCRLRLAKVCCALLLATVPLTPAARAAAAQPCPAPNDLALEDDLLRPAPLAVVLDLEGDDLLGMFRQPATTRSNWKLPFAFGE